MTWLFLAPRWRCQALSFSYIVSGFVVVHLPCIHITSMCYALIFGLCFVHLGAYLIHQWICGHFNRYITIANTLLHVARKLHPSICEYFPSSPPSCNELLLVGILCHWRRLCHLYYANILCCKHVLLAQFCLQLGLNMHFIGKNFRDVGWENWLMPNLFTWPIVLV